jgi:hypothetical protein
VYRCGRCRRRSRRREFRSVGLSFEHVPFDARLGEVLIACQRHYRMLVGEGEEPVLRVHVTEAGKRRVVGDYLVYHEWE